MQVMSLSLVGRLWPSFVCLLCYRIFVKQFPNHAIKDLAIIIIIITIIIIIIITIIAFSQMVTHLAKYRLIFHEARYYWHFIQQSLVNKLIWYEQQQQQQQQQQQKILTTHCFWVSLKQDKSDTPLYVKCNNWFLNTSTENRFTIQ